MQIKPLSQTYYTGSDVKNRYKYNALSRACRGGKELLSDNGLDWLNYGARMHCFEFVEKYDAAVARWWGQDPKAEKFYALTPYSYVGGKPVIMVDVDGNEYSPIYDYDGNFLGTDD